MVPYIAQNIKTVFDTQGPTAAQDRYRAWLIITSIYARYKTTVDTVLSTHGYGDCIVAA